LWSGRSIAYAVLTGFLFDPDDGGGGDAVLLSARDLTDFTVSHHTLQRLKQDWAGHVTLLGDTGNIYIVTFGKPQGVNLIDLFRNSSMVVQSFVVSWHPFQFRNPIYRR
jgi:hypothetical protein